MARRGENDPGDITIGTDSVVVRLPKEQRKIVARILHREDDHQGSPVRLVLDRYVQREGDSAVDGWSLGGAVTTELFRQRVNACA